jgi:hypothetical protein
LENDLEKSLRRITMNVLNPTIQHDLVAERTATIVRNIASGNNACGTLFERQSGSLNTAFIAEAVRPILKVYEDEAQQLRADKMKLSRVSEERRQVLELIYSNCAASLPQTVLSRLCHLLGIPGVA